jgi:energy-coupling factor transporter ATP-binding protein EcfA2
MLVVEHLVKQYGDLTAVDDVSFKAREGTVFGLLGPNGAGKSTSINCISGLLTPTAGRIIVSGHDVVKDGKWKGRMVLAAIQVAAALLVGTFLFRMKWGPDLRMVILVLAAWAGFCASAGLWLGTVARTEAQAGGLGALAANVLAALGGCWWPIEVTPEWMQVIQKTIPTGWTMDALHNLISFQAGAMSVVPNVVMLVGAAVVFGVLAARRFRYE